MLASIPSPPGNGVHLGPLFVHAYGLAYVVGVLAAIAVTTRRWEARGGSRELVHEVALWGFPAGLVGGRLYHLATSWNEVPDHWWGPFAVWKGGLGIWGGIALGTLGGLLVLRRRRADIPSFMDAAAPGLLVAQAIGRVGNYFNQELFGGPTTLPWGLHVDVAYRPAGYAQYATFHPTFLYELLWNVALAGALIWLGRHRRIRAPGLFALYVAGYSGFRIFEELLRVDPAHHILGLRLNFFVAVTLCAIGVLWFARIQRGRPVVQPPGPASVSTHDGQGLTMRVDVVSEIGIVRPPGDVATYAADPDNATAWYENIDSVVWQTPRPLAVGSRLEFVARFIGRRLAYTYEVVDHVPGERFVMRTAQGPFPMETTYTWQDDGGVTRMTLRNRGQPTGFAKVTAPMIAAAMRHANRKDLERLKQILEQQT